MERALRSAGLKRHVFCYAPNFSAALGLAAENDALFTTLQAPFQAIAQRLGMSAFPLPFDMPTAPVSLLFRRDYGDPFGIWVRRLCLETLAPHTNGSQNG